MPLIPPSERNLWTEADPRCIQQALQQGATWTSAGHQVRYVIGPTEKPGISHIQPQAFKAGKWLWINGAGQHSYLDEKGDGQIKSIAEIIESDDKRSAISKVAERWLPKRKLEMRE